MQINVSVTDANNIVCEVVPPQPQVIVIDRGVEGNGIVSIVPVTISTFQYLRITYTNGTVQDVGPLTSTAYTATAPITIVGNTISLATVPIASGGTDATTAAGAIQNLLPSYTGNGNKRLGLNSLATALEWVADGGGTVTSVAASGGTTGLSFTGSPITSSGTLTLGGTLAVANGGTGQTTANGALNALLPTQTGNASKYLQTDGTNATWDAISLSTADITGILGTANGGTGLGGSTPFTANGVVYASSTSALTTGSALTFDGTALQTSAARGTYSLKIYNSSDGSVAGNFGALSGNVFAIDATGPANTMTFLTGGSEQMRLTSTGLGIGTSSPSNKLHVVSTTSDTPFRSDTSVAYNFISLVNSTGNAFIGSNGNNLIFQPAGTTQLTLSPTALTLANNLTLSAGTANGVTYLNGSKVLTSGSALTFDGTNFGVSGNQATAIATTLNNSNATVNAGSILKFNFGATNTGYVWNYYDGADFITALYGAKAVLWNIGSAGGSEQMRLTSTGLGIGTSSPSVKLQVYNNINGTPFAWGNATRTGYLYQDASGVGITNASGTGFDEGVYLDTANSKVVLYTNSTERATLDSSGNLGLGVTPSAWDAGTYALQFNGASLYGFTGGANLTQNAFYGGAWKYVANGAASYYSQLTGSHRWYNAPSGTAGNAISFTQAMTLDASGDLYLPNNFFIGDSTHTSSKISSGSGSAPLIFGINGTEKARIDTSGNLTVGATSNDGRRITASGNTNDLAGIGITYLGVAAGSIAVNSSGALTFNLNNSDGKTERARIDSSGNFMIGVTSADRKLVVADSSTTGTGVIQGIRIIGNAGNYYDIGRVSSTGEFTVTGNQTGVPLMTWVQGGSERARIDSYGNLLVGTSSISTSNGAFLVLSSAYTSSPKWVIGHASGTASGNEFGAFQYAGTTIGNITQSGTTAVAYNTSSDYRLKNITGPITNSGAYIDSLNPVEGTWKADGSVFVGLLAHEAQEASRTPVATGTKDGAEMQAMDYSSPEIIANLIAEVKSLRKRLADAGL